MDVPRPSTGPVAVAAVLLTGAAVVLACVSTTGRALADPEPEPTRTVELQIGARSSDAVTDREALQLVVVDADGAIVPAEHCTPGEVYSYGLGLWSYEDVACELPIGEYTTYVTGTRSAATITTRCDPDVTVQELVTTPDGDAVPGASFEVTDGETVRCEISSYVPIIEVGVSDSTRIPEPRDDYPISVTIDDQPLWQGSAVVVNNRGVQRLDATAGDVIVDYTEPPYGRAFDYYCYEESYWEGDPGSVEFFYRYIFTRPPTQPAADLEGVDDVQDPTVTRDDFRYSLVRPRVGFTVDGREAPIPIGADLDVTQCLVEYVEQDNSLRLTSELHEATRVVVRRSDTGEIVLDADCPAGATCISSKIPAGRHRLEVEDATLPWAFGGGVIAGLGGETIELNGDEIVAMGYADSIDIRLLPLGPPPTTVTSGVATTVVTTLPPTGGGTSLALLAAPALVIGGLALWTTRRRPPTS